MRRVGGDVFARVGHACLRCELCLAGGGGEIEQPHIVLCCLVVGGAEYVAYVLGVYGTEVLVLAVAFAA